MERVLSNKAIREMSVSIPDSKIKDNTTIKEALVFILKKLVNKV